jgi:hypothetical protein
LQRRINSLDAPAPVHSGNEKALSWPNLQPRHLARYRHGHKYPPAVAQSEDDLVWRPLARSVRAAVDARVTCTGMLSGNRTAPAF